MARRETKAPDSTVVGRLAGRGEEAMSRLMDELGRNRTVTEALTRALAAKGMLDSASRTALTQVGVAPVEEVRELTRRVTELENRLAKLESGSPRRRKSPAKPGATSKRASTAKTARSTTARTSSSEQT
jgi:hypothetical protein